MIIASDFKDKYYTSRKFASDLVEKKLSEILKESYNIDNLYFTIEGCLKDCISDIKRELENRGFIDINWDKKINCDNDEIKIYFKIS